MNNSNAPFTLKDFQGAHANVKDEKADAEINYTINGQVDSFKTVRVSGGFSQTLISGGADVAVGWRYPGALEEGDNHYDAKDLTNLVFYLGIKGYSGEQSGEMAVNLEYFNDEYGIIKGTIKPIKIVAGDDVITFSGTFSYKFPDNR